MASTPKITYTKTDEAPALATRSFLPVINAFTDAAGVEVELKDISLAGRILAKFPNYLPEAQQVDDALAQLGEMVKEPGANIIKLPNISASVPQLIEAITELQAKGYEVPDYPEEPQNEEEKKIKATYDKVKGSAVNPVLREGNSDRRAPKPVKEYARKHPHRMGEWSADSKTHVTSMQKGDFYGSEKSYTLKGAEVVNIMHEDAHGKATTLKEGLSLREGEVIDSAVMKKDALRQFLTAQKQDALEQDVLYSIHLKATMMKVSDPILFGHAVETYFEELFQKHGSTFDELGVDSNYGLASLTTELQQLPAEKRESILKEMQDIMDKGPDLYMVDSDAGITNLHVPSDVIIDASMPALIRNGGRSWDKNNNTRDTKAIIPDRAYAGVYQETIDFCKKHGAFDPRTMGSVSNVGLMAQKAEEYGSHDKTFEITSSGKVKVITEDGDVLLEHEVNTGDIWRMCQTKDDPIRDWVKLAVKRARESGLPAVFWLDENRAHDRELINKVNWYLQGHTTEDTDIQIMEPVAATRHALERMKEGKDTISVTGNVLRDYLTDLFPILEVGTSAKMLSIVPLMNGGGLFETGAGGSAPKHVQQFEKENHLRWDSLGEFLALAVSLEHLGKTFDNRRAMILSQALDNANTRFLANNKSPSRKVGELDTRGSHFYLALYWAQELMKQSEDTELKEIFTDIAKELSSQEDKIVHDLAKVQGSPVSLDGYYQPDEKKVIEAMRPSDTFNQILKQIKAKA
ncbi:MAG: NADP-dependent isocitrate dehydrogenase [Owenweeksia sp.]|nr:NADP-dependent isocitrate dehydrogenase [Owenweeksia sp.]